MAIPEFGITQPLRGEDRQSPGETPSGISPGPSLVSTLPFWAGPGYDQTGTAVAAFLGQAGPSVAQGYLQGVGQTAGQATPGVGDLLTANASSGTSADLAALPYELTTSVLDPGLSVQNIEGGWAYFDGSGKLLGFAETGPNGSVIYRDADGDLVAVSQRGLGGVVWTNAQGDFYRFEPDGEMAAPPADDRRIAQTPLPPGFLEQQARQMTKPLEMPPSQASDARQNWVEVRYQNSVELQPGDNPDAAVKTAPRSPAGAGAFQGNDGWASSQERATTPFRVTV